MSAESAIEAVRTGTLEEVRKVIGEASVTEALKLLTNTDLNQTDASYGPFESVSQRESLLHLACMYNIKRPEVAFYLMDTFGLHMNMTGFEGATPLMYACRSGMFEVVERFFKTETEFKIHDNNYFGLLHYCFMGGYPSWPRTKLIELGYTTREEEENVKMKIVELLFSKIPASQIHEKLLLSTFYEHLWYDSIHRRYNRDCRIFENEKKGTVLDLIICNQYEKALPLLISKGAMFIFDPDLQIKDETKRTRKSRRQLRTFVHWCIETRKDRDFISNLLQQFHGKIIDCQDASGNTPLQYLVFLYLDSQSNHKQINSFEISETKKGKLEAEFERYCLDITEFLLENGANVNARSFNLDNFPYTTLGIINIEKSKIEPVTNYSVIKCLLLNKAKVYNDTHKEYTGLIHQLISEIQLSRIGGDKARIWNYSVDKLTCPASEKEDQEVVKRFKETLDLYINEFGIDVDERSEQGRTGLHYCCLPRYPYNNIKEVVSYNTQHIIQYLIDLNADINAQDNLGYTPLMYAVKYEMFQQTAILMKLGADSYIEGNDGMTATSLAHGCSEKTELFLNTVRKSGVTYGEKNNLIAQCQA